MDFEILYRLYFRDVYRYVRGLSRDEHLAEEIAQETFARALGAVDRFDGRGDVRRGCSPSPEMSGWTIAAGTGGRRSCRGRICPAAETLPGRWRTGRRSWPSTEFSTPCRSPIKRCSGLRVFGELPFRAIGQVFGKTEGWARVTYYRAKSRILRQWEAERDESEL